MRFSRAGPSNLVPDSNFEKFGRISAEEILERASFAKSLIAGAECPLPNKHCVHSMFCEQS